MTPKERSITFTYGVVQTAHHALEHAIGMLDLTDEKELSNTLRKACDLTESAKGDLWRLVNNATTYKKSEG